MKHLMAALLFLTCCAKQEAVSTETVDTREPVAVMYVGAPQLDVREQPNDKAPVIATYQSGEAMSILSKKGDWSEVRTGERAGWARTADLTDAAGKTQMEENPQPKFRVMPMPVSAPSAHGDVYIEADVNSDGDVVGTRILSNTTGSDALAIQNEAALKGAKFYPIMQKGEARPFKYYHRVTY